MVAVIIYHSPCQKKFLPCYMIIFVSIFISPISNNPTDPRNMVSALVLSTTSCFFSWVYHFMGKKVRKDTGDYNNSNNKSSSGHSIKVGNDDGNGDDGDDDLKNPRLEMRRFALFTEKSGNPYNYSQVEGNDDMSGTKLLSEEVETGKVHGDNESENENEIENDGRRGNSTSSSSSRGRDGAEQGADEKSCRKKTLSTIASELKLTIIGMNTLKLKNALFSCQTRFCRVPTAQISDKYCCTCLS